MANLHYKYEGNKKGTNIFYFPLSIESNFNQPFVKITFYNFSVTNQDGTIKDFEKQITNTFFFEAPENTNTEDFSHSWGETIDWRNVYNSAVNQFIDKTQKRLTEAVGDLVGAGDLAEQYRQAVMFNQQGKKVNDYKAMSYDGMNLRSFDYSFPCYPHNRDESKSLFNIINKLKEITLPDYTQAEFRFPQVCLIEMYTTSATRLFKTGFCGIEQLNIDYCPSQDGGLRTFNDGYPTGVKITLKAKELFRVTESTLFGEGV